MSQLKIARALISVSDKSDLATIGQALANHGIEIVSTGGTSKSLKAEGFAVRDVSELTKSPEMMNGRVKTLHPAIHGGLLFQRNNPNHCNDAEQNGILPIDLVYINLYPFQATIKSGADFETAIENIDIGGPAMLRAAAKNAESVAVCSDLADIKAVLAELDATGRVSEKLRRRLAAKTYARTAAYDAAIAQWYTEQLDEETTPDWVAFGGKLQSSLRYGENSHQKAAFYTNTQAREGVATATQIQGKSLSYNNINDTDAAFELIGEISADTDLPAVAIIKHANPCGVARGSNLLKAYNAALSCDPVSAFGSIIALNRPLTGEIAEAITRIFTEVVIAPGANNEALDIFAKKKNLRLLLTEGLPDPQSVGDMVKSVAGGLLVQSRDHGLIKATDLQVVTKRSPSKQEIEDLLFAWRVVKHVKSNTIIYAKDQATVGIGAGQMSRVDAARIAAHKAEEVAKKAGWDKPKTQGCVAASDAFFPFADGMLQAAEAGARAIIQPGGSIRDEEVIAAADEAGLAMVFTGMRHFRH